jgi:hypothetical protein
MPLIGAALDLRQARGVLFPELFMQTDHRM